MKLENQVCTYQQAVRLKELGVNNDSLASWYIMEDISKEPVLLFTVDKNNAMPAYTVAELGEMLPGLIRAGETNVFFHSIKCQPHLDWECYYMATECGIAEWPIQEGKTEAQARAALLIYLLENNLLTP